MNSDRNIILRHFINGEATLEEFLLGIDNINSALEISETSIFRFKFGLKLTVDKKKLNGDLVEKIKQGESRLPKNLFYLYDPEDRGPGTSYRQILFNPSFSGVVVNADLDQYIINTRESLEQILELIKRVEVDKALYATGSRNVPVILAKNERNSNLRIIHELFHSLVIGSEKLRVDEKVAGVTPAYAEIGESTSGFVVINFAHPAHPILTSSVFKVSQEANMRGFATDYYVAIKSAQIARLAKGYVRCRENKFYEKEDELDEPNPVKRLIKEQTKELSKTDVRYMMWRAIGNKENTKRISEFYSQDDVELVRDLMLESLLSQDPNLKALPINV